MFEGVLIGLLIVAFTLLFVIVYSEIEYYLRNKKK